MTGLTTTPLSTPDTDAGYDPVGTFTARVLEALGENLLARGGLTLRDLLGGLCAHADLVDAAATPTVGGWPAVFDLDATLWPATLAPLKGVPVPPDATAQQVRDMVAAWEQQRGTAAQILAAAHAAAPGKRIDLLERLGSPWKAELRLYQGETTEADRAAVEAAVMPLKPVGIILQVTRTGPSFAHFQAEHEGIIVDHQPQFPLFLDELMHVPEPNTIP